MVSVVYVSFIALYTTISSYDFQVVTKEVCVLLTFGIIYKHLLICVHCLYLAILIVNCI